MRENARRILSLFAAVEDDKNFRSAGGDVIYAIDSNIAQFLCDPVSRASPASGHLGFGAIFGGEGETQANLVANALAEHLFIALRANGPMLMIPPVTSELTSYVKRLSSDVAKRKGSGEFYEQAETLVSELARRDSYDGDAESLIRSAQEYLFLRYGKAASLRRIRHMLSTKQILSSDVASQSEERLFSKFVKAQLQPERDILSMVRLSASARVWSDVLSRSRGNVPEIIARDGYTLARIEEINKKLSRGERPTRLVYVSSDRSLFDAVAARNSKWIFLRDPVGFLSELSIFERAQRDDSTSMVDVLKFLANLPRSERLQQEQTEFSEHWQRYLAEATASFQPHESVAEYFYEKQILIHRYTETLKTFQEEMVRLQEQTWEDCFSVGAFLSGALETKFVPAHHPRNVPPIVLEDWTTTQAAVDQFLSWHLPEHFVLEDYRQALRAIQTEDRTGYARYLALAALAASRGDWGLAVSLARRANERADLSAPARAGGPNGREATFLEAVARRHDARSIGDLDEAEVLLSRAVAIHSAECSAPNMVDAISERFQGERIALMITRLNFAIYQAPSDTAAVQVVDQVRQIYVLLNEHLVALRTGLARETNDRRAQIYKQLEIRSMLNLIWLSILSDSDADIRNSAASLLLDHHLADGPIDQVNLSYFAKVMILSFRLLTGRSNGKKSARDALMALLTSSQIRKHAVFPYDRHRFEMLAKRVVNI